MLAEWLAFGNDGVRKSETAFGGFLLRTRKGADLRLMERRLCTVKIAPKTVADDGSEAFSEDTRPVRARIVPVAGGLESHSAGLRDTAKMCMLMPSDCGISLGDGVCVAGDAPEWRCVSVQEWTYHTAVNLERIAGTA